MAYDRVEGVCVEINVLGVHDARLDVGESRLSRRIGRQLEHAVRNVGGQDVAGRPNAFSRRQSLVPRAGRHVEYPAAGPNLGQVKHQFSRRPLKFRTPRPPRFLRSATSEDVQLL